MSQAEIIGYIIMALSALLGLYYTVCKPMLENQKTMTELTCAIKELSKELLSFETSNKESHENINKKLDEHDDILRNHETRIYHFENKDK